MAYVLSALLAALAGFAMPVAADARCAGMQGDALEQCLKGKKPDAGSRKVTFFGADGARYDFEADAVTGSIETVCQG